ncbi:unnamed protein product, partial [Meganyctiphanes norvegica]
MDEEVKHDNENIIKSEESYHPHDILQNSAYETVKVEFNSEIEVKEEPVQIQAGGIQIKKEIEIYEEPIAFTGESYLVKHDLTHTISEKSHQLTLHTEKGIYLCSQCDKAFSHRHLLKHHLRTHTGEKPY